MDISDGAKGGFRERMKRVARTLLMSARDGLRRIQSNKTQAVFTAAAFAAAVFAVSVIGLVMNSSFLTEAYSQNPLGAQSVTLRVEGERTGIDSESVKAFAEKNPNLFEALVPYGTAENVELRGISGKAASGTAIVTDDLFFEYGAVKVTEGKSFSKEDSDGEYALVSEDLCGGLFGEAEPVGQTLKVNNRTYKVSGVFTGKYGCDLGSRVILPAGNARMVLGSSDPGAYVFMAKGDVGEAKAAVEAFGASTLSKTSEGSFKVDTGSSSEGFGIGLLVILGLMLIICGFILIMLLLFPARKTADFTAGFEGAYKWVYIILRGAVPAFVLSLTGALAGGGLGVAAAALYVRLRGLGFFMSPTPLLVPLISAVLFAVIAAVSAETVRRLGGGKDA